MYYIYATVFKRIIVNVLLFTGLPNLIYNYGPKYVNDARIIRLIFRDIN